MPLITVIAGRYAGTYQPAAANGASGAGGLAANLGILSDDGFELSWSTHAQEVRDTDAYGRTLLQTVYQGADWRLRCRCKEYASGNMNAAWPWGITGGLLTPKHGVTARLGSDVAGAVVLTSTTGTPAAASPATLTASTAILTPATMHGLSFTSRVREVPIEWSLLPYTATGNEVWFTVT